jgi:hypothetical protein
MSMMKWWYVPRSWTEMCQMGNFTDDSHWHRDPQRGTKCAVFCKVWGFHDILPSVSSSHDAPVVTNEAPETESRWYSHRLRSRRDSMQVLSAVTHPVQWRTTGWKARVCFQEGCCYFCMALHSVEIRDLHTFPSKAWSKRVPNYTFAYSSVVKNAWN